MPDQDLASKYMDLPQQGLTSMAHTPPYSQHLSYQQAPTPGYNPPGYSFPPMYPQSSYPGYPMGSYLSSQCPSPSVDEKPEDEGSVRVGGKGKKMRKPRTIYSSLQLQQLNKIFQRTQYLSLPERAELAAKLGLTQTQVKVWFQNKRSKCKKTMKILQAGGDPGVPQGTPVVPGSPLCSSPVSATSPLQPYTTPLPISPPSLTQSPSQIPYSHSPSIVSPHSQHQLSLAKKSESSATHTDSHPLDSTRGMGSNTPNLGPPPPPPPPPTSSSSSSSSSHLSQHHLPQQYSPYTPPPGGPHSHLQNPSQSHDLPNPSSPHSHPLSNPNHQPPTSIASHCYPQQTHVSHYAPHHSHNSPSQTSQGSPHMGLSGPPSCLPPSQNQLSYPSVKEEYMPPPPPSSSPHITNNHPHQPSSPQNPSTYHWQVKQEHASYPYTWYSSDHLHLYH